MTNATAVKDFELKELDLYTPQTPWMEVAMRSSLRRSVLVFPLRPGAKEQNVPVHRWICGKCGTPIFAECKDGILRFSSQGTKHDAKCIAKDVIKRMDRLEAAQTLVSLSR